MNCTKCKNPIADDSQECEWCGYVIISKINNSSQSEIIISLYGTGRTCYENVLIDFGNGAVDKVQVTFMATLSKGILTIGENYFIEINSHKKKAFLNQIIKEKISIWYTDVQELDGCYPSDCERKKYNIFFCFMIDNKNGWPKEINLLTVKQIKIEKTS
jgi:hypothetical protein